MSFSLQELIYFVNWGLFFALNYIQEGFSQIDKLKWLNACNHVKNNIELKCWKEDGIRE
jgi:hypothetical protein